MNYISTNVESKPMPLMGGHQALTCIDAAQWTERRDRLTAWSQTNLTSKAQREHKKFVFFNAR